MSHQPARGRISMRFTGILAAALACAATSALADTTVIHAGSVITDSAAQPSGPATITVTDGRIVKLEEGFQPTPDGATLIHLPDHTALPGLTHPHPHLSGAPTG